MTLAQLLNRPCTITTRTFDEDNPDARGNPTESTSTTTTVCELQAQSAGQGARRESTVAEEVSTTTWLLVLPADTEIHTGASVTVDGLVYEVTGEPWIARNPRTQLNEHIEATVKRTSGAGA